MKYRKKPVVVEAFKYGNHSLPEWFTDKLLAGNVWIIGTERGWQVEIETLEGVMIANSGDYIIRGIKGEIYPCKPDIFEATYEAVEEGTHEELHRNHG